MLCDVQKNTLTHFIANDLIDENMKIVSPRFGIENQNLSNLAKDKYNVKAEGNLFSIESKEYKILYPTGNREDVRPGDSYAIINTPFFTELQANHDAYQLSQQEQLRGDYTEKDKGEFYQLNDNKELGEAIQELDNHLLDFMKQFGVKAKEFEDLKSKLGVDALGATDVMNKLIWYAKNRNAETIPEEVGHMATMLMGEQHPDIQRLFANIEGWSEYQAIKDQYMPIYNNEKQVKMEAIGKLIAKSLVKNYKISGTNKTLLENALDAIRAFIIKMLSSTSLGNAMQYNEHIADNVALHMLMGDKNYISKITAKTDRLNYEYAIKNNPLAKSLIDTFTKMGAKLTGSLAIAAQGSKIYRPSDAPIHDIDFNIENKEQFDNIKPTLDKLGAVPIHFGWDNKQKDYKTLAFFIPAPGFRVEVTDRDYNKGNGWVTGYKIFDSNDKQVEMTTKNLVSLDFFIYKGDNKTSDDSIFKSTSSIYKGKLSLSPLGNEERMFQREKDQEDYVLHNGPISQTQKEFQYFQLASPVKNKDVDDVYDRFKTMDSQLIKNEIPGDRHYMDTQLGKRIDTSLTEKIAKEKEAMPELVGQAKIDAEFKRDTGSDEHALIENYVKKALIDENGYARATPLNVQVDSNLDPIVQNAIKEFSEEMVKSFKPGTRFLVETKLVNRKSKETVATTADLIAIEPNEQTGIKVHQLDWKTMGLDTAEQDDIAWWNRKSWKQQMGGQTAMVYQLGIKPNQLGMARMVPMLNKYTYAVAGDRTSGLMLSGIEIGKINDMDEKRVYLIPVPLDIEKTGNVAVDRMVRALTAQYEKLYKTKVEPEEKFKKDLRLNELSKAIRILHVQMNFSPLVSVGRNFLKDSAEAFKSFENVDYSKLSKDEVNNKLGSLISLKNSAEKFIILGDVFLSQFPKESLNSEQLNTLNSLEKVADSAERMIGKINDLQREYVVELALKQGLTTEADKYDVLNAEREVANFAKTFLEGSKLSAKLIKLGSYLIQNAKSLVAMKTNSMIDSFSELLIPLEKEAKAAGKNAFDMIGKITDKNISLIKKLDKKLYEEAEAAKDAKDKQFFLDNMDVEAYMEEAEEIIKKRNEDIDETIFSEDEEQNNARREREKKRVRNNLSITSETFNGYKEWQFNQLFMKHLTEENHLSQEYIQMSKSKAALDMWNFFVGLNKRGIASGYLSNKGTSFFALVEASMLQRLSNSDEVLAEAKDLFKDAYTVRASETADYSKLDPETHMLIKEIPKPFTRTDRSIKQLSTDLNKVGTLWIKALLDYESNRQIENTLLTLHAVEKNKGHLVLNENGDLVIEDGEPKVDDKSNKNADILLTIIDDGIYGLKENLESLGNVSIKGITDKFSKDADSSEKKQLSIKKLLRNANKLIQAQAVGLKSLVAAPHYLSTHFQGFINSGQFYKFSDWEKNHVKIMIPGKRGLSMVQKLLLNKTVPISDELASDKQKEIASKIGLYNYLAAWSFNDVVMSTASFAVKKLQITNALAFNDNSMIRDGKIVNIRQYVTIQDQSKYKSMSYEERRALEKTYESRVQALKDKESLTNIAKVTNHSLELPEVSEEEWAKYRTKVANYSRTVGDLMSEDDKAGYTRDTLMRSFMMFRNWITKGLSTRTLDINKNLETDSWEYGRARAFFKTWAHVGLTGLASMREVMLGTEKGLKIMDEMLQQKKEAYFKQTGQDLKITDEEFYDLIRNQMANQMKEIGVLVGLMGLIFAVGAANPGSKDPDKNKYNFWAKLTNKLSDRLAFYYNPLSFQSIAKGSFLPAVGVLSEATKFFKALSILIYAEATHDQKLIDHTHPTKYFFDIVPVANQVQLEWLPYFFPDISKAEGVKTTTQARPE